MSFFGLGDITFDKDPNRNFGPLSALEGTQYEKNTYRYPIDAGNFDKGHYMVFFVRTQKQSTTTALPATEVAISAIRTGKSVGSAAVNGAVGIVKQKFGTEINRAINDISNKINSKVKSSIMNSEILQGTKYGKEIGGFVSNIAGSFLSAGMGDIKSRISGTIGGGGGRFNGSLFDNINSGSSAETNALIANSIKEITDKSPFAFLNTTTATSDAIALYMPDTLLFNNPQSYGELRPGKETLGQLAVAAPGLVDAFKKGGGKGALQAAIKSGAAQSLGSKFIDGLGGGDTARAAVLGVTGKVVNPMLEMIYSSPSFRDFQFDFFFYPRSEAEALQVQLLINRFRYHSAPELSLFGGGKQDGLLIPPSTFDIKFFYAGRQNPNIPTIGECVLKDVTLNYAPNGWSAYEVPGENDPELGRTGMPVAIQMTLQFTETTYLTKQDFANHPGMPMAMSGVSQVSDAGRQKNVFNS
jgi:hypothetical protein